MRKQFFAIVLITAFAFTSKAASPVHYEVKQKFTLGGDGGWDYLTFDPAGKRLFISRGTHVMVVDPYKGSVVGDIPDTAGVHGIAVAQDLGKGFTSNGRDNSVTVFDLKTLKQTNKIKIDGKPEFGVADGKGGVFVNIEDKSEITSIDAKKATVVKSWPLAPCEEPSGLAMDQKHRRLFAGCGNKMMAVVDADSGKVIATP